MYQQKTSNDTFIKLVSLIDLAPAMHVLS